MKRLLPWTWAFLAFSLSCAHAPEKSAPAEKVAGAKPAIASTTTNSTAHGVQRVYQDGVREFQKKRYREAIAAFDLALEKGGNFALPHFGRGLSLLHMDNYQEASQAFAKAIAAKPNFYQAYYGLARCQRMAGKFREAERSYLAALQYSGTEKKVDAGLLLNMGILYDLYLAEPGSALKYYREYVRLSPDPKQVEKVNTWIQVLEK